MTVFRTICVFACLTTTAILAQGLSVSSFSATLGEFPSWESPKGTFTIKNTLEQPANLLRVRSSCSCAIVDFTPCTLAPGQDTSVSVSIPKNTLSGKFSKTVYVETDAPGQEFLKLTVSGTAVPAVEVQPKSEVYLGRLEAGKARSFSFRLVPASPDMSLKLLPADEGEGLADATLLRNDDTTFTMKLNFTPDASRRYVAIRRRIAIEWKHDIPPLTLAIMFSTVKNAKQ
jgi:hypothetical protein